MLAARPDSDPRNDLEWCCLGIGCEVAGVEAVPLSEWGPDGTETTLQFMFGKQEAMMLAPAELVEWLGFTIPMKNPGTGYDFAIDWPRDQKEPWRWATPYNVAFNYTEYVMIDADTATLSALNDEGFTFAQIADLIDYFGIKEAR